MLKLLNLTKRITDLLSITKLLTVFETFDTETDAVRSFRLGQRLARPSALHGAQHLSRNTVRPDASADGRRRGRSAAASLLISLRPGAVDQEPLLSSPGCSSASELFDPAAVVRGRRGVRRSSAPSRASSTWSTTSPTARAIGGTR